MHIKIKINDSAVSDSNMICLGYITADELITVAIMTF